MKYSVKQLAKMYIEYLNNNEFDVKLDVAQPCDLSTYNEYEYQKLIQQFDKLYENVDTFELTEHFLKGE